MTWFRRESIMRKIDLSPYTAILVSAEGKRKEVPYEVGNSIISILFAEGLNASDTIVRHMIALKVREAGEGDLLLDETEYGIVKKALEAFKNYSENDAEFILRVFKAE